MAPTINVFDVCECFSGLGYIAGAQMSAIFHGWQWALRVSIELCVYCNIILNFTLGTDLISLLVVVVVGGPCSIKA